MGKISKSLQRKTGAAGQIEEMTRLLQASAAWLAGVDPRTLRDAPVARRDDGRYDARAVCRWLVERAGGSTGAAGANAAYLEARARRQHSLADIAAMRAKRECGELIERVESDREQVLIAMAFKNALTALPRQLAVRLYGLPAGEIEQVLRTQCNSILRALSDGRVFDADGNLVNDGGPKTG